MEVGRGALPPPFAVYPPSLLGAELSLSFSQPKSNNSFVRDTLVSAAM